MCSVKLATAASAARLRYRTRLLSNAIEGFRKGLYSPCSAYQQDLNGCIAPRRPQGG
jgi:hypothetical protein